MNEATREEFNEWVRDGRAAALESHHQKFLEEIVDEMGIQPKDRILDLGCGDGWACSFLAPRVPEGSVVGVDISDEMIGRARARSSPFPNVLFVWAEAEEIPWQENFFSHVLCMESAYYFGDSEKALREIYRVLAPGGSVWMVNHLSKENELSLRWLTSLRADVQLLSAEEWGALLARCGYVNFRHRMIPDRNDAADGSYQRWFPDPADVQRFRELGALLLTAGKPVK